MKKVKRTRYMTHVEMYWLPYKRARTADGRQRRYFAGIQNLTGSERKEFEELCRVHLEDLANASNTTPRVDGEGGEE